MVCGHQDTGANHSRPVLCRRRSATGPQPSAPPTIPHGHGNTVRARGPCHQRTEDQSPHQPPKDTHHKHQHSGIQTPHGGHWRYLPGAETMANDLRHLRRPTITPQFAHPLQISPPHHPGPAPG